MSNNFNILLSEYAGYNIALSEYQDYRIELSELNYTVTDGFLVDGNGNFFVDENNELFEAN